MSLKEFPIRFWFCIKLVCEIGEVYYVLDFGFVIEQILNVSSIILMIFFFFFLGYIEI